MPLRQIVGSPAQKRLWQHLRTCPEPFTEAKMMSVCAEVTSVPSVSWQSRTNLVNLTKPRTSDGKGEGNVLKQVPAHNTTASSSRDSRETLTEYCPASAVLQRCRSG